MAIPNINCTCCGPPPCTVDVSDSGDITNWTQVSGTWTEGTGNYIDTSSADALMFFNTPNPFASSEGGFRFSIIMPTTGTVRALFAYLDNDNYLFLEIERMGGLCPTQYFYRLGVRSGGVDDFREQYNFGGALATSSLLLCYNGDRFTLNYFPARSFGLDTAVTGSYGTYVGFQTIGITGTAQFSLEDFYTNADGYCSGCTGACTWCFSGSSGAGDGTPKEISVYLEGVTNLNCGDCVALFDMATIVFDAYPSSATPDVDCEEHASRSCTFRVATGCDAGVRFDFSTIHLVVLVPGTGYEIRLLMIGGISGFSAADGRFSFTPAAGNWCNQVLTDSAGDNISLATYGAGVAQQCDWTTCSAEITPNIT